MVAELYGIKVSSRYVGKKAALFDEFSMDRHHVITCNYNGREIKFDYYPSKAHPSVDTEQDLKDALYCFVGDAQAGMYGDIDDFASEFGYDNTKPSVVIKTYKACRKAYKDFKNLVGEDNVDMFMDKILNVE